MAWCEHCRQDRPITRQIFNANCSICGSSDKDDHNEGCRGPVAGAWDVCTFCNKATFALARDKAEFDRLCNFEATKIREREEARYFWLKVQFFGLLLLVCLFFIAKARNEEQALIPESRPAASSKSTSSLSTGVVNTSSGVSLREEPGKDKRKVMVVPNGAEFKIVDFDGPVEEIEGKSGKWISIEYSGKAGWVFDGFVKVNGEGK